MKTDNKFAWTVADRPMCGYFNIENNEGDIIGRANGEYTAKLMSAAPDLLAALDKMTTYGRHITRGQMRGHFQITIDDETMRGITSVLARARGTA